MPSDQRMQLVLDGAMLDRALTPTTVAAWADLAGHWRFGRVTGAR
ncbi:hypothetical protein [Ferrimicrobium sp.]|nr:hypothetical protein [Ferrimicrobium sp.]